MTSSNAANDRPTPVALDAALDQWMREGASDETREVIVELAHELRQVMVEPAISRSGRPSFSIRGVVGDAATESLQQLVDWLKNELALKDVVPLRAARACAVRTTPAALREMIKSPLILAIKTNRRLR